ncbi:MAG TPA: hypothetical protein VEV17_20190 [Bryobacteraceae bacterium]|nr:hypothetical protein [Bryobacteraceae bacterium]
MSIKRNGEAAVPLTESQCVVYEWPSSDGLLISRLLPRATRIRARVQDRVEDIRARVPPGARAFLFHLSATFTGRFPLCRAALIEELGRRGIQVINGAVLDISKRTLQLHCRQLGLNSTTGACPGDPDELLIVKTNMNYGAADDRVLSWNQRRLLGLRRITREIKRSRDYIVVRRREVKEKWWQDSELAIERYINNPENRIFKLYRALDHVAINDMINPHWIKKPSGSTQRVNSFFRLSASGIETCVQASDVPSAVIHDGLKLLDHLSMLYGTLDIAMDEAGKCYIIDLNSTPAIPNKPQPDVVEHLRGAFRGDVSSSPEVKRSVCV